MIHFERRLGASWSTDQKPVWFGAFHLTLHPFRVEMRVSALAMLVPGHYLKRLKPISHPYGDVLLAKYRACARGHVLEHQRVANHPVSRRWNASPTLGLPGGCCSQEKVGLLLIRTISHYDSAECRVGFILPK